MEKGRAQRQSTRSRGRGAAEGRATVASGWLGVHSGGRWLHQGEVYSLVLLNEGEVISELTRVSPSIQQARGVDIAHADNAQGSTTIWDARQG